MTQLSFQLFLEVCIQQKRAAVHDGFFYKFTMYRLEKTEFNKRTGREASELNMYGILL